MKHAARGMVGRPKKLLLRISLQIGMALQQVKIIVVMEERHIGTDCDGANETIDQLANGPSPLPTRSEQCRSIVVIGWQGCNVGRNCKQPAQVVQMPFVPSTGEHLHTNHITSRDFRFQ